MPFEIFRRHQRKLLAVFAIMAMFAFVVSDSLPRLLNSNAGVRDQKVVELNGKAVYRSELNELARQRSRANMVFAQLTRGMLPEAFGGLKTRDLVDAYILQNEADRLGLPVSAKIGYDLLKSANRGILNRELFDALFARFSNEISEEEFLTDLANQSRIQKVRDMRGQPMVTPYDVFRAYRDQSERIAAKLVEIPVDSFLAKAPEPSAADVQALFEKYKDVLPDPTSTTPGFKVPRQVQVEILSIDGASLTRGIRDKLTEPELRTYYENHKTEYEIPSELPRDLFAEAAELTPAVPQPFADVRDLLATRLADEKAQAEIVEKFSRIKDEVLIPFTDKYHDAIDELEEAKKTGAKARVTVPTASDLKDLARREGLNHETSPLLSRDQAERYGVISGSEVGLSNVGGGRKFADEFFNTKTALYEPVELSDILGTRFLVRKIQDVQPHVPTLDQIRSEVIVAWKLAKVRPLAAKAADEIAAKIKAAGGTIKEPKVDTYRIITQTPLSRLQFNFLPGQGFDANPYTDATFPEVSYPGKTFREAYFDLRPGSVAVAPNQPETIYYVLALDSRDPATFSSLYATAGDALRYQNMARQQAYRAQDAEWMEYLRKQAGLKSDWTPLDETNREDSSRG